VKVMPSLQEALSKMSPATQQKSPEVITTINVGDACKNSGCTEVYTGLDYDDSICSHHPGVPIFHEGCKYWSCCERKTSDFSSFLEQAGCARGSHKWKTPPSEVSHLVKCRYDHYQTSSHVIVNIYAKYADPDLSTLELNPIRLHANISFNGGQVFSLDVILTGIVDVEKSSVTMAPTKIEVKLKKMELKSWGKLGVVKPASGVNGTNGEISTEKKVQKVDVVDLQDLEI